MPRVDQLQGIALQKLLQSEWEEDKLPAMPMTEFVDEFLGWWVQNYGCMDDVAG